MYLRSGYWDYALDRRGVLFAPVYFPRHIYERPMFSYTLSIAVDIDNLEFGPVYPSAIQPLLLPAITTTVPISASVFSLGMSANSDAHVV